MKYAEFKKALDEYFLPDDEIFPHASGSVVTFYHIYHGQSCVTVEKIREWRYFRIDGYSRSSNWQTTRRRHRIKGEQ